MDPDWDRADAEGVFAAPCRVAVVASHRMGFGGVPRDLRRQASNAVRRFGQVLRDEVADMATSRVWDGQLVPG